MRLYTLNKGGSIVPSRKGVCVCHRSSLKTKGEGLLLSPGLGTTGGGMAGMGSLHPSNVPIQNTEALQSKLSRLSSVQVKKSKSGKPAFIRF